MLSGSILIIFGFSALWFFLCGKRTEQWPHEARGFLYAICVGLVIAGAAKLIFFTVL